MKSVEGIWHCPNFLGDTFELTACDDGALMLQMVRKCRSRGASIRLEPCSGACTEGFWEAADQFRLWHNGKALFMRRYQNGKWGAEVQAFRDGHAATKSFFREIFCRSTHQQEAAKACKAFEHFVIQRESSTVFKVNTEKVDIESMFVKKECNAVGDFNPPTRSSLNKSTSPVSPLLDDGSECKICMTREADVVLLQCGHSGVCEFCLREMMSRESRISCPFCRQSIEKVAKIDRTVSRMVLTAQDVKPVSQLTAKPAWP